MEVVYHVCQAKSSNEKEAAMYACQKFATIASELYVRDELLSL